MPRGTDKPDRPAGDDWDALLDAQRFAVADDSGTRISLEIAMLHVERGFPSAFYAPRRWNTADGCMPYRVCWMYFHALAMGRAVDALDTARGIGLAFAGEEGASSLDETMRTAFPAE